MFAVHIPGDPEIYNEHAGERGGQNLHLTWHAINHGRGLLKKPREYLELMDKGVAESQEVLHLVV